MLWRKYHKRFKFRGKYRPVLTCSAGSKPPKVAGVKVARCPARES
jgi:hypothetical protein